MRWPFRSKSSPSTGGESPAASDESHAPAFAASRPGSDWLSLPPAPISVSARAPRTIVGSASAIRGPIGMRDRTDVSAFAGQVTLAAEQLTEEALIAHATGIH